MVNVQMCKCENVQIVTFVRSIIKTLQLFSHLHILTFAHSPNILTFTHLHIIFPPFSMKKHYFLPLILAALSAHAQDSAPTKAELLANEEKQVLISDGAFREYRLAVLFTKEEFNSPRFNRSRDKIKAHLKELENYLNSIYVRDAGVKFTMVYDDRLIDESLHSNQVYIDFDVSTKAITNRIGSDAYDIGVVCNYYGSEDAGGTAGRTTLGCLQWDDLKGNVESSKQEDRTIAHELAHAFGCNHPWNTGSEPGQSGQSIAGYGFSSKTHFISLASLTELINTARSADNIRNASKKTYSTTNTAPRIDRDRMKREYIVPKNTFFTLPIYAADNEQTELNYAYAQWDYVAYRAAHFATFPSSHNNVLDIGRKYSSANYYLVQNSNELPVGEYKMLLSVSDALPMAEAIEKKQAPLRDNYLTYIKVVDVDKPFKINPTLKQEFKTGERFTLKWDVDEKFFNPAESKVRVLLSDDGGETFKHVLVPEAPNTGQCEVVMPQQVIKRIPTYMVGDTPIWTMGQAVLRLEVIGQGYYDITDNNPGLQEGGGTEVQANAIQFSGLPESNYLKIAEGDDLPEKPTLTASKNGAAVNVTYTETTEGNLTRRLWVATDGTDESAYVQWVERIAATAPINVQFTNTKGAINGINYLATFSAPHATVLPDGITAYYISADDSNDNTATLHKFDADILPAYQGFLLASETGEAVDMQATEADATVSTPRIGQNLLGHSAGQDKTIAADDNAYILAEGSTGLAFYRAALNSTLAANKAYLRLPEASALSALRLNLNNTTTGINGIDNSNITHAPLYDLSGRRIAYPTKGGVYIRQGRKIIF